MNLTLWTYEGPPHIGAMRVATAMHDIHYVLHAPQGDTYADLLFTMIERRDARPPVTYTTFQARDLGSDTAELFKSAARTATERFKPKALLVGASCTAELIQDDPGGLAHALGLAIPVVPLELPAYQKKENWGASETFYQLVRNLCAASVLPPGSQRAPRAEGSQPTCNLLGATALGFRHRDDIREISSLLSKMGIAINVIAPWGAAPDDISRLPDADFNVVLYPETASQAAQWLKRNCQQPFTKTIPIGVAATTAFIREVAELAGVDAAPALTGARATWYAKSVDSTYLTGKRVFVFGDGTHAVAAADVAAHEMGFTVVGIGTYAREFAREVREAAKRHGVEALITDDYLEVEARIAELQPELVLGTQMERHIAKRLGVPCAVISAPVHVQDFPSRYAPQMGFEGANVLFDTWVHPLMMGLEEHLIGMFREDFEFHDGAGSSHLGHGVKAREQVAKVEEPRAFSSKNAPNSAPNGEFAETSSSQSQTVRSAFGSGGQPLGHDPRTNNEPAAHSINDARQPESERAGFSSSEATSEGRVTASVWSPDAERELSKIPFFVRGKARRNTERYAVERQIPTITIETLYDAKAHFSR
jgi:light-independent protochlorophyllide reductase subunit B